MLFAVLVLSRAQDADLESLVSRLDHDDPAAREQATKDLAERGSAIIPRILSLYRSSNSAEVKSRTETILRRIPFEAFVQTRPEEPLHEDLKRILLRDLEKHQKTPGCWFDKQPLIERLSILRQTGSGHGQFLAIDQIVPRDRGGLAVRRIAHQGTTPYRPKVKEERVRVDLAEFDPEETKALEGLLQAGTGLRGTCAIENESGGFSSASFSMRFRIYSGATLVWSSAYSGYPSGSHEKEYAHGSILDDVLGAALANRTWSEAQVAPEDRARALGWMGEHFANEAWWVKQHYLNMARFIGDESYLPFLRHVVEDLEDKEGASEVRQLAAARDALARITAAKK